MILYVNKKSQANTRRSCYPTYQPWQKVWLSTWDIWLSLCSRKSAKSSIHRPLHHTETVKPSHIPVSSPQYMRSATSSIPDVGVIISNTWLAGKNILYIQKRISRTGTATTLGSPTLRSSPFSSDAHVSPATLLTLQKPTCSSSKLPVSPVHYQFSSKDLVCKYPLPSSSCVWGILVGKHSQCLNVYPFYSSAKCALWYIALVCSPVSTTEATNNQD